MNQRDIAQYRKKFNLFLRKMKLTAKKARLAIQQKVYQAKRHYQKLNVKEQKQYRMIAASIGFVLVASLATNFLMNRALAAELAAYEVYINGSEVGVVRTEEAFMAIAQIAQDQIEEEYHQLLEIPEDIEFVPTQVEDDGLTKEDYIVNNIKRVLDIQITAVAIMVDGQQVTLVNDIETAEAVMDAIKEPYINGSVAYEAVEFKEAVELVGVVSTNEVIRDLEDALNYIFVGTDEVRTHMVAEGESSWVIARNYDLTVEEIQKANPDLNPEKLKIGQELSLVVPKPYISVVTKEYIELVEAVEFETEYEDTDSLYEGDRKIIVQGEEGQREIKGYLIKENGVEVDREILEEKVLLEPTIRVIAEGTKTRPKTMATGVFSNPSRGRLTSRFGMRSGAMHTGIDIANSTGTPIYAADGGMVSFSGMSGSYGYLVIIDHENGYQTYYAHSSKLLVSKGERVYKGQHIANVGNTGRSTGPHLHFEVRKNGSPINPLSYVNY